MTTCLRIWDAVEIGKCWSGTQLAEDREGEEEGSEVSLIRPVDAAGDIEEINCLVSPWEAISYSET